MSDEGHDAIGLLSEAAPAFQEEPRPEPPSRPAEGATLFGTSLAGALGGGVGMVLGVAALSSSLAAGDTVAVVSLLPLVAFLVGLGSAWTGAMYWLCCQRGE